MRLIALPACLALFVASSPSRADVEAVKWKNGLPRDPAWFATPAAAGVANNILAYQCRSGGWPKNVDMTQAPSAEMKNRPEAEESTIDNGATYTQIRFLAQAFGASKDARYQASALRGIDYLFEAQYANGGWPQFYPLRRGYYTHITFNDDAMIGVLSLLREIAAGIPPFGFVDPTRRTQAEAAVKKGVACILRCQVVSDGHLTAWCAQHDEKTFAPAPARAYEKISLSGYESVGIVRFLMGIDHPSPEIVAAVQTATRWLKQVKLIGLRIEEVITPAGKDRVVRPDPAAPPTWARFYEIGTNRPLFCGRDGIIKYQLADIERERRAGYAWYRNEADGLLKHDYPAWAKKWLPDNPR